MSYIKKMSIQGIRSFGPDDSDRQVLRFHSPLTLILGPNGTGKTSIIECLKYITTGTLPAGGTMKATFIHDPKIAHESSVKAQVRLAFTNITGQPYTINRSMQATQAAKTVKMSTLDGTLQWTREDGTVETITSRCADLDREMVSLLGVGKPVIENVIFCHQEDSTWPLSEGKALKQKFDDIFASTRYTKALDNILKTRKDMQAQIKEDQVEIKYLKANKEKVQQLESQLADTQARYAASRESTEEIKEKLAPIEEKLLKLSTKEGEIYKLHTDIEKLKSERDLMKRTQKELLDSIENEFTGTTEELEQGLADFGTKVAECEEKLKQYERENQRLEVQLNEMSETKTRVLLEMGKLEQEAKAHQENLQKRQKKVQQVADQYDIEGFSGNLTDRKVEDFRGKLEEHRKTMQTKGREQRTKLEEQEQKIQARIDEIRKSMSALETEIRLKNETMKKNKDEVRSINQKLSRAEASTGRLTDIKRELKQTKQEREETEKNVNTGDLRTEIDKMSADKGRLDTKFKQLDAELSRMHQESNTRTQLDMLRKDKASKDDKVRKLLSKNDEMLVELLGEVPEGRIGKQLEDFSFKLEREVDKGLKTLEKLRMELASKTQEHTSMRSEMTKKRNELRDQKDKIAAEVEGQNIEEGIKQLEESLRRNREDKGVLEGTSAMFNKFKSKLQKPNAPCPLCRRAFDEDTEIQELIDDLDTKLRTVPQRLEDVEREIDSTQEKFERVLQLKPVQTQVRRREDKDIPSLEKRVNELTETNEVLTAEIAEKGEELRTKQDKLSSCKSLVPDMMMVDRYQVEMRDLDKKIATQSAKVSGGDQGRTLPQVQQERDDAQESLENVRSSYDRKQKRLMDHERKLSQLDATYNDLERERLNIERDLQEQKENEQKREELLQSNEILSVEILECQEQIQPLSDDLKRLKREREEISAEKDAVSDNTKDQINKLQERSRDIKTIQESIDRYMKAGRDTALAECREKQTDMEQKAEVLDTKRNTLAGKIEKRREDLQTQKLQERNLNDNLTLRKKQSEINLKTETIADKQQELGGLDVRSLGRDKQRLQQQQDELVKEKHKAEGRQQTLVESIRNVKKDLETDMYVDAEKKYGNKRIKLRTTELASSDLEKYYKALDGTIMRYHNMKIEEINKIIRELWRNTYKGNDIETIEIRSDEDLGFTAGKRRTFNYRVVMIKGDAPIDMRGRCSAGQKVLASLIIRLALAETFCLNCGVMALDEPTTNLDRENIESLAYALVEIIRARSKQKNFQLIVITHDEDFLELLGRSNFVEKFVKVRKNEFGLTVLDEDADVKKLRVRRYKENWGDTGEDPE